MSTTLNLADRLLAMGRNLHELGREHDARRILSRLACFLELSPEVAEETQVRLAEIYLRRRKFKQARRHLTAALRHRPDSAQYHFLMATALDADEKGNPERAAEHFKRVLRLEPDHREGLADYGLLAVRLGQTEEGLQYLRRLVELAPHDPEAVNQLVTGLRLANRVDEARAALLAARFRNPRDGRFLNLWNDFHFQELRREQEIVRQAGRATTTDEPVLLPFVRPASDTTALQPEGKIIRRDPASDPSPPHAPRPVRQSNQRQAQ